MSLFWFTILSFCSFTAGRVLEEPVFTKCWKPNAIFMDCDNFANCPEKAIHNSDNRFDQMFAKNINMKHLNEAEKYICSKDEVLRQTESTCGKQFLKCFQKYLNKGVPNCANDIISCTYEELSSCSPVGAMIISKALEMIKSTSCTMIRHEYQLRPFYGPEIYCYPNVSQTAGTAGKLGPNYKQFCAGFEQEDVSQCIEETLLAGKSSFRLDDDYIKEAKEFFRQRSGLCKYMNRLSSTEACPTVDVLSCQEDILGKDALQKPSDVLLKSYANCVHDKYKTCDAKLAQIIKYNLESNLSV